MGRVPKGLKDSAQGLNQVLTPGYYPKKNRPNGAAESNASPDVADTTWNESSSALSGRRDLLIGTRG
jgi:hypothetical protein